MSGYQVTRVRCLQRFGKCSVHPSSLGTLARCGHLNRNIHTMRESEMRSLLLWMIGIPIPVIILIWLFVS